jgi:hypothetical protein
MEEPDDYSDDHDDDIPDYRDPDEIDATELSLALDTLRLLGDDLFMRTQAFNLSLVDHFIMQLELQLLRARFKEEKGSFTNNAFLSAQTQMWIFAAYELLRTWRARRRRCGAAVRHASSAPDAASGRGHPPSAEGRHSSPASLRPTAA